MMPGPLKIWPHANARRLWLKRLRFKVWLAWQTAARLVYLWRVDRADRRAFHAGWWRDRDGWLLRPVRPRDPRPGDFANSHNAFISRGALYCRNGWQAQMLDEGKLP